MAATAMLVSTILSVAGSVMQAHAAGEAAKFNAAQERIAGNEAAGASERQAYQARRRGNLVASRAQAVAAGSGAGASDPTVVNLMGDIGAQSDYNVMSALYEGQMAKQQYDAQANITQYEGKQAETAGYLSAAGTLLEGGSSLYSKYGLPWKRAPKVRLSAGPYSGHGYESFG